MATIRETTLWFYATSKEFQETYNVLSEDKSKRHDFIGMKHYLLCHALELALKGSLIITGKYTENQLKRRFGHDLMKTLGEVESVCGNNKKIDECRSYLRAINDDYKDKGYEYPVNGSFKGLGDTPGFAEIVQHFIDTLIKDISSYKFPDGPMPQ